MKLHIDREHGSFTAQLELTLAEMAKAYQDPDKPVFRGYTVAQLQGGVTFPVDPSGMEHSILELKQRLHGLFGLTEEEPDIEDLLAGMKRILGDEEPRREAFDPRLDYWVEPTFAFGMCRLDVMLLAISILAPTVAGIGILILMGVI